MLDGRTGKSEETRTNCAGILGVIGNMPKHFGMNFVSERCQFRTEPRSAYPVGAVQLIGKTLLDLLQANIDKVAGVTLEVRVISMPTLWLTVPDVQVVAEALNSIFDVYSEDGRHTQAIADLQLLAKLKSFGPYLQKKVRVCRSGRAADTSCCLLRADPVRGSERGAWRAVVRGAGESGRLH